MVVSAGGWASTYLPALASVLVLVSARVLDLGTALSYIDVRTLLVVFPSLVLSGALKDTGRNQFVLRSPQQVLLRPLLAACLPPFDHSDLMVRSTASC